ncbi:MAG: DUF455 domain-containing protein, partial [Mariprofundus sp.]
MDEMRSLAAKCLLTSDVDEKLCGVRSLMRQWKNRSINLDTGIAMPVIDQPGRPENPQLMRASKVPRRGFGSVEGRAI